MAAEQEQEETTEKTDREKDIEEFKDVLDTLLREYVDQDADAEKTLQLLRLEKADFYYRGIQNIAPQVNPSGGSPLGWTPVGVPTLTAAGQDESASYADYNFDLMKTYGKKFVAVLGQRPFYNNKALPDDPQSESDLRASRQADLLIQLLRSWWNVKLLNLRLAYFCWKAGTVFGMTRWIADANKYGFNEMPVVEPRPVTIDEGGFACFACGTTSVSMRTVEIPDETGEMIPNTVCPSCGGPLTNADYREPVSVNIPAETGIKKYANGRVELHLKTGLRVTVPFNAEDLPDTPYVMEESEENKGLLMELYGQGLEKKIGSGTPEAPYSGDGTRMLGQTVRSATQSLIGSARAKSSSLWNFRRVWIRPYMYNLVKDEGKKKTLKEKFPDGMKIIRVEGVLVDLANENLDDFFSTCQPDVSDYLWTDGVMWGVMGHQDAWNNALNLAVEHLERGLPTYLADPDLIDVDAYNDRPFRPQEMIAAKPGSSVSLDNGVKMLPPATFPNQLQQLTGVIEQNVQSHTGVLPNLYGGGAPTETADQARNQLNQALMQLGTTGEHMTQFWVDAHTNAIWEIARHAVGPMQVSGETVDFEALKSGNWHIEGEIGIPRSFGERKDALMQIVSQNPQLAQALRVDDPVNIGAVSTYLDLPDLKNPDEDLRIAVNGIVDQLLKGEAVQGPDGMQHASIPFDSIVFDPTKTMAIVRDYLISGPGQKQQGSPGYDNVKAFLQEAMMAAQPPMPPGPDGQQGPPPGPQGPPPPNAGQNAPPPPQ